MVIKKLFGRSRSPAQIHDKQEALEHERLTSLVNSMADGVVAVDERMQVVLSNGAALNILDVNSSLRGKPLRQVLHLTDKNNQPLDAEQLVMRAKTATSSRDLRLKYADGSQINLYLSIAPVHLGYGQRGQKGYVLLMRDITHEKSLEEERDEFISVVSHELRTPIAIAEGNISNAQFIASKTGDIEQIKTALQQAHDQILFLADMINDLATLSRAERGKLIVEVDDIDAGVLVTELTKAYAGEAAAKNINLKAHSEPDLTLRSSRLYVREILQNFVTNALKYTDTGSVTITAAPAERGVIFTVSDTGIGISRSDQERIFDKFFRSEDYRTRRHNGTGLGLYVTLKLTRLIHAEIDVKSTLNKGSTFSIYIPNLK